MMELFLFNSSIRKMISIGMITSVGGGGVRVIIIKSWLLIITMFLLYHPSSLTFYHSCCSPDI